MPGPPRRRSLSESANGFMIAAAIGLTGALLLELALGARLDAAMRDDGGQALWPLIQRWAIWLLPLFIALAAAAVARRDVQPPRDPIAGSAAAPPPGSAFGSRDSAGGRDVLLRAVAHLSLAAAVIDAQGRVRAESPAFAALFAPHIPAPDRNPPDELSRRLAAALADGRFPDAETAPLEWRDRFLDWLDQGAEPHDERIDAGGWMRFERHAFAPGETLLLGFDISALKQAESGLILENERIESAHRAMSEQIAMMSHEIRTPMNGVLGLLDLLRDGPLSAQQRSYVETARESARTLLGLLNDVLDLSKLESHPVRLSEAEFDLPRLLASVIDLYAPPARAKGIEVAYAIDPSLPDRVRGDRNRIRQVLVNLIDNAVKFSAAGTVVIEVGGQRGGADALDVRIEVRDQGLGIAQADLARLFDPFQQIASGEGQDRPGAGLGLAICRALCEAMGGRIGLDSAPGQGSTAWFDLRLSASPAAWAEARLRQSRYRTLDAVAIAPESAATGTLLRQLEPFVAGLQRHGELASGLAALTDRPSGRACIALIDRHLLLDRDGGDLSAPFCVLPGSLTLVLLARGDPASGDLAADDIGLRLSPPVHRAMLLSCLDRACGLSSRESVAAPAPGDEPAGTERLTGSRALLVEDSTTNAMVAQAMLELGGIDVDIVGNGREAIEALGRCRYDVVLMDVAMPVMDGLSATRAIRALDGAAATVPVIAMTANAMAGDRERCLEAGMNDYIAKPVDRAGLIACLERHVLGTEPEAEAADEAPLSDRAALAQLVADTDAPTAERLVAAFVAEARERTARIAEAQAGGDIAALLHETHALKSGAGSFGAPALQQAALRLEAACRAVDDAEIERTVPWLIETARRTFEVLDPAIPGLAEPGDNAGGAVRH